MGVGSVELNLVSFGVEQSPCFFCSYGYLEARKKGSEIIIGENTFINNNVYICAEQTTIKIGRDCLIGVSFSCIDSDFHGIHPEERRGGNQICRSVTIGNNVFIGNNVSVLKGVIVGDNSVIASNSVVTKSFPDNVVIAGNPAQIIKEFSS
jgi:maltose O-acetyltransferase